MQKKQTHYLVWQVSYTCVYIYTIRIYREYEGGLENFALRITVWYHKACLVMTNGEPRGRIFRSHPRMNNGFFFLLTIKYRIFLFKNGITEVPEYAEMRHIMVTSY